MADPRVLAREYLEKNKVPELFEELGTRALLAKPDDPSAFLLEELRRIQSCQDKDVQPSVFTEQDLKTLFNMFDSGRTGKLSSEQYSKALGHLGVAVPQEGTPEGDISLERFVRLAEEELRLKMYKK